MLTARYLSLKFIVCYRYLLVEFDSQISNGTYKQFQEAKMRRRFDVGERKDWNIANTNFTQ